MANIDSPIVTEGITAGTYGEATVTLVELTHPDITGKVLRSWFTVEVNSGNYVTGGIPMGLFNYLDVRTVDVKGFLKCSVTSEEPYKSGTSGEFSYRYNPVNDTLQIFGPGANGTGSEIAASAVPTEVTSDTIIGIVDVDRTSVRG